MKPIHLPFEDEARIVAEQDVILAVVIAGAKQVVGGVLEQHIGLAIVVIVADRLHRECLVVEVDRPCDSSGRLSSCQIAILQFEE